MPSSSSRAHTWAGARSQYSVASAAPPARAGVRPRSACSVVPAAAPAGPPPADGAADSSVARDAPSSAHACLVDVTASRSSKCVVDHGFDFGSVSALSESSSKSACTFPVISNASLGPGQLGLEPLVAAAQPLQLDLLGRAPRLRLRAPGRRGRRRRGPCATPRDARCTGPHGAATRPAPPSRPAARRTRRGSAALYSAVNDRRRGRAAGSGSSTTPSWARASRDAVVMVIGLRVPVSPCRDGRLPQMSHVTLTDRVAAW